MLQVDFVFFSQRDTLRVLGHKKNFPATGKNPNDVSIRICLCSSSHILFSTEKPVEAFHFGVLVNEDYLPTILDHAVSRIAEKGENSFVWIAFKKAA